jgi:EAL domain-containing protein (putative c-di-GMP-specific phosphodiesterase class I)/FixJ family two-component response regulator
MMTIRHILIIEDDPFQLNLMFQCMSKLTNANINVALNGHEALYHLKQLKKPDLILCDLCMPQMDGIEFLREISQQQLDSKIIITSCASTDVLFSVQEMASSYGLKNVLTMEKPISYSSLEQLIKQFNQPQLKAESNVKPKYQPTDDELIDALRLRQFIPFFQPHIDEKSNSVCGAEALVRWNHPSKGILTPDIFINLLTQVGLIHELTLEILNSAITSGARWHKMGLMYRLSVNVSSLDLIDLSFADAVLDILNCHNFPPGYLTLEVTETDICTHKGKALDTMNRLRINGVELSIDDFGTGTASLMQLITSPFSELKVDKLFVSNMFMDPKHFTAVQVSLFLAQQLGLRSVAEGVESKEQEKVLKELGCNVLQGYNYAPAMPETIFLKWCSQFSTINMNQKRVSLMAY